jgi:hypothetical protein
MKITQPETLSHKSLIKTIWYIMKRPPPEKFIEEDVLRAIADSFKV